MEYVFLWLVGSAIVAAIADGRTIGPFSAFMVSLILSPLIGLIITLASPTKASIAYQKQMLDLQKKQVEASTAPVAIPVVLSEEIEKLKRLRDEGTLSDSEYDAAKKKLLN